MRSRTVPIALAAFCTVAVLSAGAADAAILAYEGFSDGVHNADLNGYSGGTATGLTGAWTVTGPGAAQIDTLNRAAGPLLFPFNVSFAPTQSGANYQWAERNSSEGAWAPGYPERGLATPIDFGADGTYYMSYLARIHANDSNMMFGLSDGTDLLTTGINYYAGTSRFAFSYGPTPPGTNSPGSVDSGIGVANGQVYFVVARLETSASGPDTISYKAYNTTAELVHGSPGQLSGTGAGHDQWTMQQTINASNTFDRLYAKMDSPTAGYPNFDEVRVGTTWTDVTSVEDVPLPPTSPGRKIGFNFVGGQGGGVVGPLEVAGAPEVNQVYWNNLRTDWHGNGGAVGPAIAESTGTVVGSNNDAALGLRIEYDSNTVWGTGIGSTTPDQRLMRGYLDDAGVGSTQPFVDLKNLPYQKYDVVLYVDGDQTSGVDGQYWLETVTSDPYGTPGTPLTGNVYVRDIGHFSGTFVRVPVTSTDQGSADTGNYIIFEGLTDPDIRVRGSQVSGTRAPLNAIQVRDASGPVVLATGRAIGFNFVGGGPGGGSLADGDVAGVSGVAQAHWNNLNTDWHGNGGAVPASVLDNRGTVVGTNNDAGLGLRVEYDSNTVWGNALPATSPDRVLMRGYLDDAGVGSDQPYINVLNVPYGLYDVVLYVDGDQTDGVDGQYWLETIAGDLLTPQVFAHDMYNFNGRYDRVPLTSTSQTDAARGNFIVFRGLSEPEFRIRGMQLSGTRAPINAFQIMEVVPEPSSVALALVGLLGLVCCWRRRRRG